MSDFITFPRIPVQTPNHDFIDIIVKLGKHLFEILTGKLGKKLGETKSQNKDSSLEDISQVHAIFEGYREQVHQETADIEAAVLKEVSYYVEELNLVLEQNRELMKKYGIRTSRIEKSIERMVRDSSGSIDTATCKSVSLDNPECRKILQMIPGTKKERAMTDFLQMSLKSALNQYCEDFHQALLDIFDEVEEEIVCAVEAAEKDTVRQCEILKTLNVDNYVDQGRTVASEASKIAALCDTVVERLEGEQDGVVR